MKLLRTTAISLACILGLGIGTAAAESDDDSWGWMPHQPGHMSMMGAGHGWPMGHGYGGMMGPGYGGMMGPGYGGMMGPGYGGMMGPGYGGMMGPGYGGMMGPGRGWMHGGAGMDPERLSDEHLDRIGERIEERHRFIQEIAAEKDQDARRELIREHLKSRQAYRGGAYSDDEDGDDAIRRGYRHGGMMAPGMMRPGMMGPGAMGLGAMTPGMMSPGQLSDEYLDRIGEHMAESHERMQQLAETTDKAARRKLVREHFESMHKYRYGMF